MSRDDFTFSHLVEDDDDDVPIKELYLDLELQPHLLTFNSHKFLGVNPAVGNDQSDSENKTQSASDQHTIRHHDQVHPNNYPTTPLAALPNISNNNQTENSSKNSSGDYHPEKDNSLTKAAVSAHMEPSTLHIQYSNIEGKVNVMQGQVVTRADGSQYIDTYGISELATEHDRPLRQRRMTLLKIFSISACLAFFPFGLLALYFAFRTEKEFYAGIMKGNIDRAQKFAKRTERLIIISFIMCLMVVALVLAAVFGYNRGQRSDTRGAILG